MTRIEKVDIGKSDPFAQENVTRTRRKVERYVSLGQEVREMLRPDVGEATVNIEGLDGAMRILVISDLHAFHEAANMKTINKIWKEINEPNTFVLFAGDLIEGIKQEYLGNTTSTMLPMQEQIDAFRELWLRPLVEKGKVLALVTRYGSHDDWPADKTTLNSVSSLVSGLRMPNGAAVPLIWNGGKLNLHFVESDLTFEIKLNHMVSGGGSALNPVKPLRGEFISEKLDRGRVVPVAAVAGHNHTRAGVSSERVMAGVTEVQLVLCQNGTIKGVEPGHPDFFLQAKGITKGPQLSGAAMVLRINDQKDGKRELQVVPTYGSTRSRYLLQSMDVLDRVEKQGMTQELIERITNRNGPVVARFSNTSLTSERVPGSAIRSALHREMDWVVDTGPLKLPLTVYTISHARFGTSEMYIDHIREILAEVEKSPNAMLLILGDMVDLTVPGKPNRMEILKSFAREMSGVSQEKRLGLMLSSIFKNDRWNTEVRDKKQVVSGKVITGDWLWFNSEIKGTPLYEGGAAMKLKVGEVDYWWYMLDGTGNFGSRQDPYLALIQLDKLSMVKNDVVTGGISTIPGALTNGQISLATGWESPAVDRRHGKDFSQRVPKGGQGVIMFPEMGAEGKIIFGGGSFRETRDTSRAMLLWRGLSEMGELRSVMKESKNKKNE